MTDTRTTAELVDVLSDPENYNFSGDGSPLDTFDTDTYQQDFATLTTRIEALERDNRDMWPVIFNAEDCVENGCMHQGLEEAVETYQEIRRMNAAHDNAKEAMER